MPEQVISLKGAGEDKSDPQTAISIHELDKTDKRESSPDAGTLNLVEPDKTVDSHLLWPWGSSSKKPDLNSIATVRRVFDEPVLAPYYQPKPDYENAHCLGANERWTVKEENALRRAIDWMILFWILVMFFGFGH
jgi:hypothetical protein